MLRSLLTSILVLAAGIASAQMNTAPTLKIVFPKEAKVGSKIKATLEVTFADGLHGYQNPPTDTYQIPVKVSLDTKGFVLGKVSYPKGIMMAIGGETKPSGVYEGTISIPVLVTASKTAGATSLKFTVNYQQCNDQSCFPPSSISGTVKVTLKK